jgi:hypothetical protein
MTANEVVWPTGMSDQDPAARERPLFFNPQGFLVAILEDADQADQAKATLAEAGFADATCGSTPASRSWTAGSGYARQGRSALWVHVPDDADAKRAVRALADHPVLHFRHYGHDSQQDIHIR